MSQTPTDLNDLRSRLVGGLAPIDAWPPDRPAPRSDFDLNPDFARPDAIDQARILRPASVLVPIIAHERGASVLLTRRADTLTHHGGQIAFPGGRQDPGETAVQAALREAQEEVALDPGRVEVLGLSETYETVTGFLITPVVGWISEPPALQAREAEVAEIFETPWDFLMDMANHRQDHFDPPTGGPRRLYWAMPWRERYIWGATAGIIRSLRLRLYGEEAAPVDASRIVAGDPV